MSEVTQYLNLGIAGIALYLMYQLSTKALDKVVTALDANTQAITELRVVVDKLCGDIKNAATTS